MLNEARMEELRLARRSEGKNCACMGAQDVVRPAGLTRSRFRHCMVL